MPDPVRVLFLADSHLGFDLPVRPRVERRRRGFDFLANYSTALAPALSGEADIVIHGGDVFDRSAPHVTVAHRAYGPLERVADCGVPVFIVPGNHERSRLPHRRLLAHPGIHVFDAPRTFDVDVRGTRISLSGFPYERSGVRAKFRSLVDQTGSRAHDADHRLLCVHHCVEGATVGPADFTFTTAEDVIHLGDIPSEFSAVLSGHIHRHQVLTRDLAGCALAAPVLYPGSIERMSIAEIGEPKGFILLQIGPKSGELKWEFRQLNARPMERHEIDATRTDAATLQRRIDLIVAKAPLDAVISLRIAGELTDAHWQVISSSHLRSRVPATMNLDVAPASVVGRGDRRRRRLPALELQHSLFVDQI